ncbi:MAG: FG-GAP-like repeat-containing protein [Candidatus Thermoplasmatota archaeon]
MRIIIPLIIVILTFPLSSSLLIDEIEGMNEITIFFEDKGSKILNIEIPNSYALNGTINISTIKYEEYPLDLTLDVGNDGSIDWKYSGLGYGSFGYQSFFSRGTKIEKTIVNGYTIDTSISFLIPREAKVINASMSVMGNKGYFNTVLSEGIDKYGEVVSNAGDVNGDGYTDVAVGISTFYKNGSNTGRVYIYHGSIKGLDKEPKIILDGEGENNYFGKSICGGMDINKDGYGDIVIGAHRANIGNGKIYVYYGSSAGIKKDKRTIIDGSSSGDFGTSVSSAQDVNNDGYDDIVIGEPYFSTRTGRAHVYIGSKNGIITSPFAVLNGETGGSQFGLVVEGIGDVNNDGYKDIAVSAPYINQLTGKVYIYHGGKTTMSYAYSLEGEEKNVMFGTAMSSGDLNNDHYSDLVVSSYLFNMNKGRVYIYYGSNTGISKEKNFILDGSSNFEVFGKSVKVCGDLNGDGYKDLGVGAEGYNGSTGRTYIYFSSASAPSLAQTFDGIGANSFFGNSISGGGDINADNFCEVIIGSSGNGKVYIYYFPISAPIFPSINIGNIGGSDWRYDGMFTGSETIPNFSQKINSILRFLSYKKDWYGNSIANLTINVSSLGAGSIELYNLKVEYEVSLRTNEIANAINSYFQKNKGNKLPINITSQSSGKVKLSLINIVVDTAPYITQIQAHLYWLNEDSKEDYLIDLEDYIKDDFDPFCKLNFSIESVTPNFIFVKLYEGHYISVDALSGNENDNWTGKVQFTLSAKDTRGSKSFSNITVDVRNVNDKPIIKSKPKLTATEDLEYTYNVSAIDGDNDELIYVLQYYPYGMEIDKDGKIKFTPTDTDIGPNPVRIIVTDGTLYDSQEFTLYVGNINDPPYISKIPNITVIKGERYTIDIYSAIYDPDTSIEDITISTSSKYYSIKDRNLTFLYPAIYEGNNETVRIYADDGINVSVREIVVFIKDKSAEIPTGEILKPEKDEVLSGRIVIAGNAFGYGGRRITTVLLRLDDEPTWRKAIGTTNWTYYLNTYRISNGEHKLFVRIFDEKDEYTELYLEFYVLNEEEVVRKEEKKELTWFAFAFGVVIISLVLITIAYQVKKERKIKEEKKVELILHTVCIETKQDCFGCFDWIEIGTYGLRCKCGKIYHEACALKYDECPNCKIKFKVEEKEEKK